MNSVAAASPTPALVTIEGPIGGNFETVPASILGVDSLGHTTYVLSAANGIGTLVGYLLSPFPAQQERPASDLGRGLGLLHGRPEHDYRKYYAYLRGGVRDPRIGRCLHSPGNRIAGGHEHRCISAVGRPQCGTDRQAKFIAENLDFDLRSSRWALLGMPVGLTFLSSSWRGRMRGSPCVTAIGRVTNVGDYHEYLTNKCE